MFSKSTEMPLIHELLRSTLLNFQTSGECLKVIFLLLMFSLTWLRSDSMLCVILVLWNLLELDCWPSLWSVLMHLIMCILRNVFQKWAKVNKCRLWHIYIHPKVLLPLWSQYKELTILNSPSPTLSCILFYYLFQGFF